MVIELTGLIQVYTGEGKGKTCSAIGLALRAVSSGLHVCIIEFLKGKNSSGEFKILNEIPNVTLKVLGRGNFVNSSKFTMRDRELVREAFEEAKLAINSSEYDVIVLDEINVVVDLGFISQSELLSLLEKKLCNVEVILTGRNACKELMDVADLVTIFVAKKHPYRRGVLARKGIDF